MSDKIMDGLAQLQQLGAQEFRAADAHYGSADGAQIRRRIFRKRAVYGTGVGVASLAAVGAFAAGASALGTGGLGTVAPAATSPSSSPSAGPIDGVNPEDIVTLIIEPGTDTETAISQVADASGTTDDDLRAAIIDALPAQAEGNYEGWIPAGETELLPGTPAKHVAHELIARAKIGLDSAGVLPGNYEETLIKASLVTQETQLKSDYPKTARVIDNRLEKGMKLELDSTVKYVAPSEGAFTTGDDRAIDSPYNTYMYKGLPPGPIGTVAPEAIEAVSHPAEGDWLYFVTVNLESGEVKYANAFEQHLENVTELQEWVRDHPDSDQSAFTTDEE